MLGVLIAQPGAHRGVVGRMLEHLLPRRILVENHSIPGGEYRLFTLAGTPDARAWRKIERTVGELAAGMVVAHNLTPPAGSSIVPYTGEEKFLPLLCVNTAARALALSQLGAAHSTVGFVDLDGRRQSLALRLLKTAPAVMVVTRAPERYGAFCEQVAESTGAVVTLAAEDSALSGCAVVAAPDGLTSELCRRIASPVVSARRPPAICRAPVLTSLEPQCPPGLEAPAQVGAAQFLGALWERGLAGDIENLAAQYGRVEGRMTTLAQFAQRIRQQGLRSSMNKA